MHALQDSATRDGSLNARRAMHGGNKLQIGLFGPNCSSGRAVTLSSNVSRFGHLAVPRKCGA